MKILFINRVFPPDDGATGQLLAELAAGLAREGWTVTVLAAGTPQPSTLNPQLSVHRVPSLPFTRASLLRRALSYASLYPTLLWRALRLPPHDVVVTLTDPPLLLVLGPWLKWFKRSRLIHWAQDVYPEVAEELGVLGRGGVGAGLLRFISTWSLRRHDRIITVGRCMKERLRRRGLDKNKITVIPNWAIGLSESPLPPTHDSRAATEPSRAGKDERLLSPSLSSAPGGGEGARRAGEEALGFRGTNRERSPAESLPALPPFTVMYSGNFGLAHPFESIVEAVKLLEQEQAPVRFVFAGSGPKLATVREQLAGCGNVEFRGHAPVAELAASLASADAHLACMNEELCGLVVPSKVYGAVAAGRPCLFLGPADSEAAQWINEHQCGRVLPAADSARALADLIQVWSPRGPDYQQARQRSEQAAPEAARVPLQEFLAAFFP